MIYSITKYGLFKTKNGRNRLLVAAAFLALKFGIAISTFRPFHPCPPVEQLVLEVQEYL